MSNGLLTRITTIVVPEVASFLVAVLESAEPAGRIGFNFNKLFTKYTEAATPKTTLLVYELTTFADDSTIRSEIGRDESETTLGQMWWLISTDKLEKDTHVFYIRSHVDEELWAVRYDLCFGTWDIDAYPISSRECWRPGDRVVSRAT